MPSHIPNHREQMVRSYPESQGTNGPLISRITGNKWSAIMVSIVTAPGAIPVGAVWATMGQIQDYNFPTEIGKRLLP